MSEPVLIEPDEPLNLTERRWPAFLARTFVLPPGSTVAYDEADWFDSLVVVESGGLDLDGTDGRSWHFRTGDVLWLVGLPVLTLRNSGSEPLVLKVISRRSRAE